MADRTRAARITKRIREELSLALRRDIRDPRLTRVLVSRVEVPDDLQLATVFIRIEPPVPAPDGSVPAADSPEEAAVLKSALVGLKAASGKLRTSISQGLGLRYTPQLRFLYDSAQETSTRVAVLLREIESERRGQG
jgi:ribosome-binding factor A